MLDVDRSVIQPGDDSHRRVLLPVSMVLVESEGRHILVDTGVMPDIAGDAEALRRKYDVDPDWIRAGVTAGERADAQLALLGLEPRDLDLVVNTHLHFDHAGGNALFAGVTIAAQEAEFTAAREDGYMPVWDAPGLQFRSVRGDWSPVPGVEMLSTPGHTPGHQSVLVRLQTRPWLFTFDAVYTEEHWRTGKLGAVTDVAAARASLGRLHAVAAAEGARLIFGHDIAQWGSLGMLEGHVPRLVAGDE